MSRRHTSTADPSGLTRIVGTALVMVIALSLALPTVAAAQKVRIKDQDVEQRWQLLTYRDANGDIEPVPAGVGATVQLFAQSAFGEAACSSYSSNYTRAQESLFIDPPQVERFECDAASQTFDEAFYRNLTETATIAVSDSILTLNDAIGQPLMTLTRAVIDEDPTVARWALARIGAADGSIEPVIQGVDPWIEFLRGGRLVGNSGCGSFLGSYRINDGTIRVEDVDYRFSDCTEGLQQQAERVVTTLSEITDYEVLPAGLSMRDADGTTRLALIPSIDLGLRTWTPVEILGDDGESMFDEDILSNSAVRFNADVAEGRTRCRYFTGSSLRSGLALSASDIDLTGTPCPDPKKDKGKIPMQAIENAFIGALEAASSHALRGSELELKDVNGYTLMRLLPQAELVGPTWVVEWMNATPNRSRVKKRKLTGDTPLTATFEDIEVVLGETGASDRTGNNSYVANYRTPAAARIRIWDASVDGRACNGSKSRKALCKQQAAFMALLELADSYTVRATDMRLLQGSRPLIHFVIETPDGPAT
jgi:heat shock protein HslJ